MPAARNVGITNVIISIIIRFYKSSLSCYFTDARSFRYLLQKCLEEMSPLFAEGRNSTWRIAAHEGSSAERTREIIWLDIDQIARAGQHGQRSVRAESIGQFRRESSLTGSVRSNPDQAVVLSDAHLRSRSHTSATAADAARAAWNKDRIRLSILRGSFTTFPPNFVKIDRVFLRKPDNKQTNADENITSFTEVKKTGDMIKSDWVKRRNMLMN